MAEEVTHFDGKASPTGHQQHYPSKCLKRLSNKALNFEFRIPLRGTSFRKLSTI
jgi:hypothetical protein